MMKKISNLARVRSVKRREHVVGRTRGHGVATASPREEGAILILALVFLIAVGAIVATLSTWATNDLNNSTQFTSANSLTLAATDMTDVAIQYVRYNPLISSSQPVDVASPAVACWGSDASIHSIPVINGNQIAVWCSTVWNPLSYVTRDVTFFACPISVSVNSCDSINPSTGLPDNALLWTEVRYDDYPPAPARSAPIQDLCSVWCGAGMTIVNWQWGSTTAGSVTGVASSVTFTNEPSDTSAGVSTNATVYVTDSSGTPVAGDTVWLLQNTGPTCGSPNPGPCISSLNAMTNSSGVAEFTNIVPASPGNYTLTAQDGAASATSSSFAVSEKKSVITVNSTAPTNATQSGTKYTVSASATTLDQITITSATTSVCTVGGVATSGGVTTGVVSFGGSGTCTLDFNDSGNANYAAAVQVTQSFAVGGLTATQVALTLTPSIPPNPVTAAASGTTNVTITMTLENAVGATVNSNGTTTLVLSDIGSGYFSATNGATEAASASSLNVSITTGKSSATAYFGDENTGPDTISAINGTVNWGSASLTIQGGAPTQVAITPSTLTPAVASTTNTSLTFQLEDAFGNNAVSAGTTTLALSNSGSGFFATTSGTTGTSTLNVTFAMGSGTATAYFGNETSGSDLITAKNGASTWATSTLTLAPGVATIVQITLSPAAPTQSATTNTTVTLQLEDQFKNHVSTSGVSLTLSNSGSGFFATKPGVAGATTLALTTNASGVATGYFGNNAIGQSDTITASGSGLSATTPPFTV